MTGSIQGVAGLVAGPDGGNSTDLQGDASATAAADAGNCSGGHLCGEGGTSNRGDSLADASCRGHKALGSRTFGETAPPSGRICLERRCGEDRRRSGERRSCESRCSRDRRRSGDQSGWAPFDIPWAALTRWGTGAP